MTAPLDVKDGGAAFPIADQRDPVTGEGIREGSRGMSLRDWFAGHVSVADYVFPDIDTAAKVLGVDRPADHSAGESIRFGIRVQAALRYALADAMLTARDRQQPEQKP